MLRYFDLFRPRQELQANPAATQGPIGLFRQFLIYLGLAVGVLIEPLFPILGRATADAYISALAWPHAAASAIIALLIFLQV